MHRWREDGWMEWEVGGWVDWWVRWREGARYNLSVFIMAVTQKTFLGLQVWLAGLGGWDE